MRGDFHIHTTFSDGALSVNGILNKAYEKELDIIAITDHDCLDGSFMAYNNNDKKVKIIIGLELSTYEKDESVHILGYFPSIEKADKLNELLKKIRESRVERAEKIKDLLFLHFGIKLDLAPLYERSSITRGSIAREMIKQNCGYTKEEIFQKMISPGCPCYVKVNKLSTEEGIKKILECDGIPILAHPVLLKKANIYDIIKYGVKGIEAIYPLNKKSDEKRFKKLAKKYNLLITAGSDFHDYGDNKHGNIGSTVLDDESINKLVKAIYGETL